MIPSADTMQDVGVWAAAALAVLTLMSKVGGPRILRWFGRHLLTDVADAILKPLEPRLVQIEAHACEANRVAVATAERVEVAIGELQPNGGHSVADKIKELLTAQSVIVGRIEEFQAQCDRRVRELYPPEKRGA